MVGYVGSVPSCYDSTLGSNPDIPQKSYMKTAMMNVLLPGLEHKPGDPPEGRHDGLYEGQYDCDAAWSRP